MILGGVGVGGFCRGGIRLYNLKEMAACQRDETFIARGWRGGIRGLGRE